MQFPCRFLVLASLAAAVHAIPRSSNIKRIDQYTDAEIHVFKRDAPLTPEDLVLAEQHDVNATEMFKHSVIKRRGEEEVTIWVDHSYEEHEGPREKADTEKRALTEFKIVDTSRWAPNSAWHYKMCTDYTYEDRTGPNAPCTGGLKTIRYWNQRQSGRFRFEESGTTWRTLVAAGSNTGCNGRFRGHKVTPYAGTAGIGNEDMDIILGNSLRKFSKNYSGRERMRAFGSMWCGDYWRWYLEYHITEWKHNV